MTTYASKTKVPVDRSRSEIESLLVRYGATHFVYGMAPGRAEIGFAIENGGTGLRVKMTLPLPGRDEYSSQQALEQATRSRWRSFCLIIKAKLEAVAAGISTVEREFMADVMLPNGHTIGEEILPQVPQLYQSGGVPRLLPGGRS